MFGKGGLFGDDDDDKKKDKSRDFFGGVFDNPLKKTYHNDANGRRAGYSITNTDTGRTDHYDDHGKSVGRSEKGMFGVEHHYDDRNKRVGRSSEGAFGGKVHYDANGREIGRTSTAGLHTEKGGGRTGYSHGRASYHPDLVNKDGSNPYDDLLRRIHDAPSADHGTARLGQGVSIPISLSMSEFSSDHEFQSRKTRDDELFVYTGDTGFLRFDWMLRGTHEEISRGNILFLDESWEFLEIRKLDEVRVHYGEMLMIYAISGENAGCFRLVTFMDGREVFMQIEPSPDHIADFVGALRFTEGCDKDRLYSVFTGLMYTERTNPMSVLPKNGLYLLPDYDAKASLTFY